MKRPKHKWLMPLLFMCQFLFFTIRCTFSTKTEITCSHEELGRDEINTVTDFSCFWISRVNTISIWKCKIRLASLLLTPLKTWKAQETFSTLFPHNQRQTFRPVSWNFGHKDIACYIDQAVASYFDPPYSDPVLRLQTYNGIQCTLISLGPYRLEFP